MPIQINQIVVGNLYKTPNNQERVVLGIEGDDVVYASRGGNVLNDWKNQRTKSSLQTFSEACDEDLGKVKKEEFEKIKKDNNY